jgi:hypothetical protein
MEVLPSGKHVCLGNESAPASRRFCAQSTVHPTILGVLREPAGPRVTQRGAIEEMEISEGDVVADDGDDVEGCFSPDRNSDKPITNLYPAQMLEGTSGVYLLANKDTGVGVAVFKPFDEENFPKEATSWAVSNGTGYFRERAAYVVSDQVLEGISEVPKTVIATVKFEGWPGKGEKRGSLQVFVPDAGDMSDRGPANIPVEEVQKVGILDILLFNMDRHEGNLLLQGACNSLSLVPIDHGLCLPEIITAENGPNHELLKSIYFVWQNWPQAKQPFSDALRRLLDRQLANDFLRQVVGQLRKDMDRHTITCAALTTLKIGALVLKNGVGAGLNLSEIATLVSTKLPEILQRSWEKAGKLIIKTKAAGRAREPQQAAEDTAKVTSTAVVPFGRAQAGAEEESYLFWEAELLSILEALLRAEFCSRMGKSAGEDNPREFTNGSAFKNGSTGGLFSRFEEDAVRGGWERKREHTHVDMSHEGHVDVVPNARIEMISVQAGAQEPGSPHKTPAAESTDGRDFETLGTRYDTGQDHSNSPHSNSPEPPPGACWRQDDGKASPGPRARDIAPDALSMGHRIKSFGA